MTVDAVQTAWSRLRQFQDRAAIVMESDLARRADMATLGTTVTVLLDVDGSPGAGRLLRERPPLAELDQAASRLRPIFLEQEEVHHAKVTKSLGMLATGTPDETRAVIKELRKAWQTLPGSMYYSVGSARGPAVEGTVMRTDRQIALDYLYGELVHADRERIERLKFLPEGEKYIAALLWTKDGLLLTRATQQLITDLEADGALRRS
jgi:hypothetical protein